MPSGLYGLNRRISSAMFRIRKLYTEPEQIDPVEFSDGVNIILGEKDETSQKTNGVGKSLCVEFINFALMKTGNSRVFKIPATAFNPENYICLDLEINGKAYTIKRSVSEEARPVIYGSDQVHRFDNTADATKFLTELVFASVRSITHPSFRKVMGPLMRDERSEFKSIISCYDTKHRIPDDYEPHLYFFGLELTRFTDVKEAIGRYDELNKEQNRIKQNISLIRNLTIKDARSELNQLDAEVKSIEESIDQLEMMAGFDAVKNDIMALEEQIEQTRRDRDIARRQLRRLRPISRTVDIDVDEVTEFYSDIAARLGEIVQKDLAEVLEFKEKIDDFQNNLIREQRERLKAEAGKANERLVHLEAQYRKLLSVLNQEGNLRSLKQTYAAYKEKADELAQLRSFVSRFDKLDRDKQQARIDRETRLLALQAMISESESTVDDFEEFILDMHQFIQGNRKASFAIDTTNTKQVVDFVMRIDDDGSHSVEREKVFMYDLALLLSPATRDLHPGFLLHDNIFDVDDDTLRRSLEYVYKSGDFALDQQYIITFNADQLSHVSEGNDLDEEINSDIRASFTKSKRFLKAQYQEI